MDTNTNLNPHKYTNGMSGFGAAAHAQCTSQYELCVIHAQTQRLEVPYNPKVYVEICEIYGFNQMLTTTHSLTGSVVGICGRNVLKTASIGF